MINLDFWLLVITTVLIVIALFYIFTQKSNKQKSNKQLSNVFIINFSLMLIISSGVLCQVSFTNVDPYFFEKIINIGRCLLPVSIFFTGLIFVNTKISFKKRYLLTFIIPILTLIIVWTNDYHHLFYTSFANTEYGPYFYIHNIYSYLLMITGIGFLLWFSVKNSGFFSKQSVLILIGLFCPFAISIFFTIFQIPSNIYATPIAFSISVLMFMLATFKFNFLSITPIALQKVVDRMSDSYLVIDDNYKITDFNKSFNKIMPRTPSHIRNKNVFQLLVTESDLDFTKDELENIFQKIKNKPNNTIILQKYSNALQKYFNIEISSIVSHNNFLGILLLFKDNTQHIHDMQTIQNSQEILIENERLATLGQMIGGIAHNLKTPIMSISGAKEGLQDLIKEYKLSIGDPDVTLEDHHEIANDMQTWIDKISTHLAYMSDVITTVKGQAVNLSAIPSTTFTIGEVLKQVDILMKHELKNALVTLNITCQVDENTKLKGYINSLVQVINNIISNAIQSYNGKPNNNIDLNVYKKDDNLIISVKDYGVGISQVVQDKLFNSMITTKGKKGTGLGLFMSYSNIKVHFNGNISFKSKEGQGSTFYINLPLQYNSLFDDKEDML